MILFCSYAVSLFTRQVWTGPHVTFFNFSFSLIRCIAQWHKHTIYFILFLLLMRLSLTHRLLRLIEGRWIAIREVLKGLGRMRNTRTESIVKEIFLLKMRAICRPGNRKSWPIVLWFDGWVKRNDMRPNLTKSYCIANTTKKYKEKFNLIFFDRITWNSGKLGLKLN